MEGVRAFVIAFIALYMSMTAMAHGPWTGNHHGPQNCSKITCGPDCERYKCTKKNGYCMRKEDCKAGICPSEDGQCERGWGHWCKHHRKCKCCVPICLRCIAPKHGSVIDHLPNGILPNHMGSICIYSCDEGYHLDGAEITECLRSGTRSNPPPQCIPNTCETCGEPQNGFTKGDHPPNPIGTNCTYHCDSGHQLEGHNTTECLSDGTIGIWSNPIPTCTPNTCDTCGIPQDGGTTGDLHPNNTVGTTCTYHCDEGFHLVGHETATCLANETWSSPIPLCIPNTCETCGIPQDGFTIGDNPPNPIGTICEYFCDPGYILEPVGDDTNECLLTGAWSIPIPPPTPKCINDCHNDRKCNREKGICLPRSSIENSTLCANISPSGGRAWCTDMQNCACCYPAP